jgi:hypothetical protein
MASVIKSASMALAGLMLTGCYASSQPLDDQLTEDFEHADAGVVPQDAAVADASAPGCTGADPIALLLCRLVPPAQQPQQPAGIPELSSLLNGLGGLANVAEILGPIVGTPNPRPGTEPTGGLVDLVNLAGGLGNIAQLFNQLLGGGQSTLPSLFTGAQPNQQQPSLADFLENLGIPVADPVPLTEEPSAHDCAAPATPAQQFACALQQTL